MASTSQLHTTSAARDLLYLLGQKASLLSGLN
jgi:hypothetical protein